MYHNIAQASGGGGAEPCLPLPIKLHLLDVHLMVQLTVASSWFPLRS